MAGSLLGGAGNTSRGRMFSGDGMAGVGVFVAEKWLDNVVGVRYINERLIVLKVRIGKLIMNFVFAYFPTSLLLLSCASFCNNR